MYYNYIRMIEELYAVMDLKDAQCYSETLRLMIDECVMHFMEAHNVPFERQGEFLASMFYDCPRVVSDYKSKRFTYHS